MSASSPLGAAHGRDEVIPWRMHEKDPLAHAPILPLLRALGRHGAGYEKATEHVVSLSAAKAWLVPGAGEPPGGTGQNPCKGRKPEAMASPRRCPERPFARAAGLSLVGVDAST